MNSDGSVAVEVDSVGFQFRERPSSVYFGVKAACGSGVFAGSGRVMGMIEVNSIDAEQRNADSIAETELCKDQLATCIQAELSARSSIGLSRGRRHPATADRVRVPPLRMWADFRWSFRRICLQSVILIDLRCASAGRRAAGTRLHENDVLAEFPSPMKSQLAEKFYDFVSDDEDARVCRDIPESACDDVPGNFLRHLISFTATKTADALSKPGLILTWLLSAAGASSAAIGLLVPVREAGSLLPQMVVGGVIRRFPVRKGFWAVGSLLQGLSVCGMAVVAVTLTGPAAGWAVVALLAAFSLARGVCSIASKDLIGKTIPKTRRGRLSGWASSIAGYSAVAVGLFFAFSRRDEVPVGLFAILLGCAALLWLISAGLMWTLQESPGATSGGGNAISEALSSLAMLKKDHVFRRFCIARALMASTVLSMPFYVVLARDATGSRSAGLGILMVSGSIATALSAIVWGRLADRSSRITLTIAGGAAGVIGCATAALSGLELDASSAMWLYGVLFFSIGLAHTGIRVGRKTYLVDMATAETRASMVAVSNTLIGIVLLLSGSFGFLADVIGERAVILVFALLGLLGSGIALSLPEVQEEEEDKENESPAA